MYGKSVLFSRVVSSATHCRRYGSDGTKRLLEFLADMPKANSPRISEAQRQRQQIAKKSEKYGPSSVYLQVLGSGARGAPNTLYLFTDQKRYLFNCGEQTQRLAHEHKVKLSRLDHIFITSKTWRNIGGLPGLSLTLQDVGVPSITLHGPEGLDELYNATRRFVIMKDMNVTMAKCGPSQDFEDNVMTVKYVVLKPNIELVKELKDLSPVAKKPKTSHQHDDVDKAYEQFIHDDTDYYNPSSGHNEQATSKTYVKERVKTTVNKSPPPATSDRNQREKKVPKNQKVLVLLEERKIRSTVCYICILKKRLGTLDLAKCVELGVKPGPMLGQLKNGHDVVLPDGTLVLSKDVKTPDDPGPVFIVLEVPDISYLRAQEFSAHFANGANPVENIPTVVVHFTPPEVFHNKEYQDFIAKFGPSTRHIILNAQNSCLGSEAVHRTQHKLHLLDPDIFPLLKDVSVPAEWTAPALPKSPVRLKGMEELKNKIAIAQFQNILHMESSGKERGHPPSGDPGAGAEDLQCTAGRTLTVFHLRPRKQLDRSSEPKLHIQDYIHETMDVDGFVGSLEQFRRLVDNMRYAKAVDANEYPKVVFLGTGSCIPSKTRNTSAIALHVDENRSILLDCGEGTFGQLVRFYGPKRVNSFLRSLRAIYISHLHADHHIGLIGVLQARRQAFEEVSPEVPPDPVFLIAPGQIATWLTLYDQQFERIKGEYILVPNQNLVVDAGNSFTACTEFTPGMLSQTGATHIRTCVVPHCPNAFGVCVDIGPHRITYSGDTLPCEALIKLGANSTLLIHEATMEDELAVEARVKMHSTTTQAIDIGRKMNAKFTVLTHFSQRYARLPRLNAKILHDNTSVGVAFDNMQITMSDLDLLPHMYAPLQLMFAEHCVEMELKAAHRARQKQRASKGRTDTELASASLPDVSHAVTDPLVDGTSKIKASETMSYYRPYYKDSHSSRLRAEAWSLNSAFNEPKARRRRRTAGARPPPSAPTSLPPPGLHAQAVSLTESSTGSPGTESDHPTIAALAAVTRTSSATNDSVEIFTDNTSPKSWNFPRSPDSAQTPSSASPVPRSFHPTTPAPSPPLRKPQDTASVPSAPAPPAVKEYGKPLITNMKTKLTLNRSFPVKATMKPPEAKHPFSDKGFHKNRLQKPTIGQKAGIKATGDRLGSVSGVTKRHPDHSPVKVRGLKSSLSVSSENELESLRARQPYRGISSDFSNLRSQVAAMSKSKNGSPDKMKPPEVKGFDRAVSRMKTKDLNPVAESGSNVSNQISPLNQNHGDRKTFSPDINRSKLKDTFIVKTGSSASSVSSASNGDKNIFIPKHYFSVTSGLDNNNCEKQILKTKQEICEMKCMSARHSKPIPNYKISSFGHYKGFTPQLEDIKSSFLLLNTRTQRLRDMARKQTVPISWKKPEPLNEEERRKSILQVKSKFQSKKYWQDQKYENIEGLNWISWK